MTAPATVAIPKRYLWLVVGFLIGSYIGFAELADLLSKVGSDVKETVLEPAAQTPHRTLNPGYRRGGYRSWIIEGR